MNSIKKFMSDRNAVNTTSTMVLFVGGIHFFLLSFLDLNLLYDLFGLGSYTLYRVYEMLISLGLLFLALSLYLQNKKDVDQTLESTSKKLREEASELGQSVEKQISTMREPKNETSEVSAKIESEKSKQKEDFTKPINE